ncbi:glycosyltransferase [Spirosoma sordidisoli]|uniref:Glycosyl transferase family 28 C-terminal domain-containing protein n=1 Tax=Spirosoma sordidisoli TaxID=2502893 RepID=A0A4V1RVJ6_9BACT|nr:hypothetical protein [Spirosoma sordidisoli]RYC66998.1 hypothetical protein EQG79_26875 [Spirosoma sordidisoli]
MKALTIPYFAGGLSHLIPLYVLQQKYLRKNSEIENHFLVDSNSQKFLMMQGISCVPINYSFEDNLSILNESLIIKNYVMGIEREAYCIVKPSLVIEDTSFLTPLIAEKNNLPRISIQRTGIFRSIDKRYRNASHMHSLEKGSNSYKPGDVNSNSSELITYSNPDFRFLQQYAKPKAKIIPGIPAIERLPEDIEDKESYFYSGPLLVLDKPSKNLTIRLREFLNNNEKKPIVFITTGTVDKTPIEKFIEFFVKRNYAVITTCSCVVNETYARQIFYNKFLPLHHICGLSDLVIHQCGSGMYHYPIMNGVPSLTIGTQCYDREDIAIRLQELGVSGHVPHPDDNPNYWTIFLELINRFESDTLTDYDVMKKLQSEIASTMTNFEMGKVIQYALA